MTTYTVTIRLEIFSNISPKKCLSKLRDTNIGKLKEMCQNYDNLKSAPG